MYKKKISVITVVRNAVKTIEQTIKSVINQKYDNVEYIIIDGGSTDGTIEIIRQYEKNITYWISEPDKGVYDAMNKGISYCSGDIINFLNSDDYYIDGALEYVANYFEKNILTDILCCEVMIEKDKTLSSHYNLWEKYPEKLQEGVMMYSHQGIFAKRKCFDTYNNFDASYRIAADYAWLLDMYNSGRRIEYSPKCVAVFRYGGLCTTEHFVTADEVRDIAIKALKKLYESKKISPKEYEIINDKIEQMAKKRYLNGYANMAKTLKIKMNIENNYKIKDYRYRIFGAGENGYNCLKVMKQLGLNVESFLDNNPSKWNEKIDDICIVSPQKILDDDSIIIVSSQYYEEEIFKQLEEMGKIEGKDFISCTKLCDIIESV